MLRGQELGARLERLQKELEQAAQERQEFLREKEFQQQRWGRRPRGRARQAEARGGVDAEASPGRYRGLEQRMKTELQAAATSKEEALRKLKARAQKLEEELSQVRPGPGSRGLVPPSLRPAHRRARPLGPRPSRGPSGLAPQLLARCSLGACWRNTAERQADSATAGWSLGLVSSKDSTGGFVLR